VTDRRGVPRRELLAGLAALALTPAAAPMARAQISDEADFFRTFRHGRTRVNDVTLHHVSGGEGPPVLLIHGWLGTWYTWRKVMPLLAQRHSVVAVDVRGYGDSDKPDTGYDARTLAIELRELMRQLGHQRVIVVGHDMGALPAFGYASLYPSEVRGLVYMDEPLPGYNLDRFLAPTAANGGGYWQFAFQGVRDLPESLIRGQEREYLDFFLRRMLVDQRSMSEADRQEYVRTLAAPGGLRGSMGWYRAIWETSEQFREWGKTKLAMPVLAVRGQFGHPGVEEQMRLVASDVKGITIAGAGHLLQEEQPMPLSNALLSFFGDLAR
jgi:pimeloyl-ACP methyl ester carboxylesterase